MHLGNFAAKISKQPLKEEINYNYILISMQISSGHNVSRLRID